MKADLVSGLNGTGNLIQHKLVCTGTTGKMLQEDFQGKIEDIVRKSKSRVKSGPL
jgi:methylglyoxal synthase